MNEKSQILIVDDDLTNLKLFETLLTFEGHDVVCVESAPEAIEYLKEKLPDLILMDIQMPGMDGLTLTRLLRSDESFPKVPIVAVTALAMAGDKQKALDAGCDGYITKPINTRTFAQELGRIILERKRTGEM